MADYSIMRRTLAQELTVAYCHGKVALFDND
jgi:hypothetical protein